MNKKAFQMSMEAGVILILILLAAIGIGYFFWKYAIQEGGGRTEKLFATLDDVDGDKIANQFDKCCPAVCTPGKPVDDNFGSEFYGCTEDQGPTKCPEGAEPVLVCNPRAGTQVASAP